MAYTEQTIFLTGYDTKVENNGATAAGKLSATEFNTVVDAIIEAQGNIQSLDTGLTALSNLTIVPSSGTTLTAAAGNYYTYASTVSALTITLPSISNATQTCGFVVSLTTGSSIDFHLTPAGGETIRMYSGLDIVANTSYELNFVWNGTEWIVAYGEVVAWT